MIDQSRKNGWLGEIAAARYLRQQGYTIAGANYRTRQGEVDIIARRRDLLVFCEVKARSPHGTTLLREAVGPAKQRRVIAAALHYMRRCNWKGPVRFDVIEVLLGPDGASDVHCIENAFTADASYPFGV